jgi:diguanylate cyclase (GGDEF)-like protein/PAS domain S-box-containing protein
LGLAFDHASISAVWPPTGVALAVVLLGGYRMLGAVALGAFLANVTTSAPLAAVLVITLGNTLEALAGAFLLRRAGFEPSLQRMRDVVALIALAAVISTAISATFGIASLLVFGHLPLGQAAGAWRIWWLGDMGGDLLVATTVLVLAHTARSWWRSREAIEMGALGLVLAGSSVVVLGFNQGFVYLVFPMLFLLALLFRQRGAVLGGLIVSVIAVWFTSRGHGAFTGQGPDANLVRAQTFVSIGAITALLVAAARTERHVAETAFVRLAEKERALGDAQRLANIGSFEWDLQSGEVAWSSELYRILGLAEQAGPSHETWRRRVHPDDRADFDRIFVRGGRRWDSYASLHRIVRDDGQTRTMECHARLEHDAAGMPQRMVGSAQDITPLKLAEERFRSLFSRAPYPQVVIDHRGAVVLANAKAEELFGHGHSELIGRSADELIPPRSAVPWYMRLGAAGGPDAHEFDLIARRQDGSEFPVEVSLTPLRTEDETLVSAAIRDVTERKLAAEALAYRANHDSLTGLPNRTLFLDRLEHALGRARRSRRQLAVMFLDLDDFKLVNDTRGHDVGDLLLVALTPRLTAALRPGDTIARFGGDEFVVLCEELDDEGDALAIARRIGEACSGPVMIGDYEHVTTVSAGVVLVPDADDATPSRVLRDADAAMYRAKATGKGRTEVFDDGMRARLIERMAIETSLRRAVQRGELRLVYQPVVALGQGKIVAAEALLRWEHPRRGVLEPDEFIPVAESSGLIVPIGEWVIEQACRQAAAWRDAMPAGDAIRISVNVSPRQIAQPDLAETVARILERTGLEPQLLELEITERTVFEDTEAGLAIINQLKSLGVRLVLDDFGTGYSSLRYLKRLSIDSLKIDRSFVCGLGHDSEEGAIVSAVLSMAGALGLGVTAEGVETRAQLSELRQHGCEYAQGYLFCRPSSSAEMGDLLGVAEPREQVGV